MDICEDAYHTTSNPLIITVWIGLLLQNILCIIGILILSYFLIKYKLYHLHLRILILSLHFAFLLRTFGTTYRGFDFLFKLILKRNDNCNLLQTKSYCTIISAINGAAIGPFLYTFAAISVERIIASIFYHKYESYTIAILPIMTVIGIWIHPVIKIYNVFTNRSLWIKTEKLPYCNSFTTKQANIISFIKVDFPICLVVFCLNLCIYFYCKYRLKSLDDTKLMDNRLTVKFELKEILSSTVLVTILAIIYTIDAVINTALVYIISITNYTDNKSFAVDKELSAYIIPIYILIYIGAFILFSDKIKKKVLEIFCKPRRLVLVKNNTVSPSTNDVEKYFEIYNNTWA